MYYIVLINANLYYNLKIDSSFVYDGGAKIKVYVDGTEDEALGTTLTKDQLHIFYILCIRKTTIHDQMKKRSTPQTNIQQSHDNNPSKTLVNVFDTSLIRK